MELFAIEHYIFSTSFNNLINGKIDVKRRIVIVLLVLDWLLIILIFSKLIPFIKQLLKPYVMDLFSVLKEDTNSYIIMAIAYLTNILYQS